MTVARETVFFYTEAQLFRGQNVVMMHKRVQYTGYNTLYKFT